MAQVLIYFIAGLFLALLFLNLYFRWKVIKVYKRLIDKRVAFNSVDIFKTEERMREVFQKYPDSEVDIRSFIRNIRVSVAMAILIILLITFLGLILHYDHN